MCETLATLPFASICAVPLHIGPYQAMAAARTNVFVFPYVSIFARDVRLWNGIRHKRLMHAFFIFFCAAIKYKRKAIHRILMKTWLKALLITLVLAVPAFMLGPVLWPPSHEIQPTSGQLPFFILLSAIEAIVFGLGVAFLILTWPYIRAKGTHAIAAYISIGWMLISWWPHDNMHIHNGLDPAGLLLIEYLFHVTLIIAACVVGSYFYKTHKK
jgi:hypothetical protein